MAIETSNSMARHYSNPIFRVYIPQYRKLARREFDIVDKKKSLKKSVHILSSKSDTHTPPFPLEINGKDGFYNYDGPFHNQNSGAACVISPGVEFS